MASISAKYSLMETGTLAWRSSRKKFTNIAISLWSPGALLALLSPCHEGESLEQMDVLLVLEQRAMQRRNELLGILGPQRIRRHVLDHQQLQPVEQFRGGRLLLEPRHFPDVIEDIQRLAH